MTKQVTVLHRPDLSAQGDPLAVLRKMRVLFLPKNSRTGYFTHLLRTARETLDWETHIVGPQAHEKVWHDSIGERGSYLRTPDFAVRQPWEDDANASAAVDAFIAECERANGISAGRIILSGERDVGRGYSETTYYWFKTPTARRVLADNTEPTRIVRRMFAFARDTLNTVRPSLVVAGEWADPLCFTLSMAARPMGIPCVVNRLSKLWSGRCYWSADPMMYNSAAIKAAERMREANAPVSNRARERIDDFRKRPETVGYVKQNWDLLDSRGFVGTHRDIAAIWFASVKRRVKGEDRTASKPAFQILFDYYRRLWLSRSQRKFLRRLDEPTLRETKYIYIALHKDPEQALNYQAPFWSNQLNTIALLCGALPYGYRLLVREQRNNTGRRPTTWYQDVARLPGVVLIDGFDDQFKYIRNADLVVTDNGSTGWEGLVLGRRTATLADTYYDGAGLAHRVLAPEYIGREIEMLLRQEPVPNRERYDHALACMLDAEWEYSAPVDKTGTDETFHLLGALAGKTQSASHFESVTP